MINFTNFTRTATAAVGALVLSTSFITAAIGPAASANAGSSYAAAQTTASVQEQQA